ncbi:unnamed protein product [Didymodactylos carnosus]|uniref:TRPM SLOG domain-containing protein n=1 Tax=Didymodactylos carnosus TaxID=1234261 RepID=A0A814BJP9_9BILA|nr:unnamed protein product [Didymodactylos carnosus]CAF3708307.1 unnamed protein product [Didymodactylos carnosus]
MIYVWELPTPDLIISITGGEKTFKMAQRIRNEFQRHLVSIAIHSDAWIFTGGADSGVMKEVGDAVDISRYKSTDRPKQLSCIGIANWYFTTDYEQLQSERERAPCGPLYPDSPQLYRIRPIENQEISKSNPLNPDHTHFILLEDDYGPDTAEARNQHFLQTNRDLTITRNNLALELRAGIEDEARNAYKTKNVTLVQILLNGGRSSLSTVFNAIERNIPVIVINNTGQLAKLIAETFKEIYPLYKPEELKSEETRKANATARKEKVLTPAFVEEHSGDEEIIPKKYMQEFINMIQSLKGYYLINILDYDNEGHALRTSTFWEDTLNIS